MSAFVILNPVALTLPTSTFESLKTAAENSLGDENLPLP